MTDQERKHLAQADRHIAECKGHIANQEEVIPQLAQRGQLTLWAEDMLDALKGSLRAVMNSHRFHRFMSHLPTPGCAISIEIYHGLARELCLVPAKTERKAP